MRLALLLAAAAALADVRPRPIQIEPGQIAWTAGPASLPKGSRSAVLEGDPKSRGIFTMRLKLPAGVRIPPHTHPRDERVTVLSGSVLVGFGEEFSPKGGKRFGEGAFYVNPPGLAHFVFTDEEAIIQLTGEGPWVIEPVR